MPSGTIGSQQFREMADTGKAIEIVAPQEDKSIVVVNFIISITGGSIPYKNGGPVGLQYGLDGGQPPPFLGGCSASQLLPSILFTAPVQQNLNLQIRGIPIDFSTLKGEGIYLSNMVHFFTDGDLTFSWNINYSVSD